MTTLHDAHCTRSTRRTLASLSFAILALGTPATSHAQSSPADILALRRAVADHDWTRVDRALDARRSTAAQHVEAEGEYLLAYHVFETPRSDFAPHLDAWVAAEPTRSAPRIARATYRLARAWNARGYGFADEVTEKQLSEMTRWLHLSWDDGVAALRLDSTDAAAYLPLLAAARLRGRDSISSDLIHRALSRSPASVQLRLEYMQSLRSRWGGSREKMDSFAADAQSAATLNPAVKALRGFAQFDAGTDLRGDGQLEAALVAFNGALRSGDAGIYRMGRARTLFAMEEYERAAADVNRAIALAPGRADALALRAAVFAELAARATAPQQATAFARRAKADLDLALELDPDDTDVQWARKYVPSVLP